VAASDRHCLGPGDLSADHIVDLIDHAFFADCLSGPDSEPNFECAPEHRTSSDLDQDGDVDLADVALFAQKFDNTYFDYGPSREDKEAEHLAIKLTGELRAPDYEYDRISRDLVLMGQNFPDLVGIGDFRRISDNGLWVQLYSDYDRDEFDLLNTHYLTTRHEQYFPRVHFVEFCDVINPAALDPIYSESSEIEFAYPSISGCPGCCGGTININEEPDGFRYELDFTYDPDTDVCGCWRFRILRVNEAGDVIQVSCEDGCLPECP
jgi:hypothetical protein